MNKIVKKIKSMPNASKEKIEGLIINISYKNVLKNLKNNGIEKSVMTDEEFKQLLAEEVAKNKAQVKGILKGALISGILMTLGLGF